MEAFSAGKPVLTTTDSGGVLSIVRDGETGVVTEPTAEALGGGLLKLVQNRVLAGRMGAAGRLLLQQLNLTWPQTLARLMS
jgi:glycosyltransferase involved in cell wall biosynthesis